MAQYIWLVVLFPLIGFLINGFFWNKLSQKTVSWVACGALLLSFLLSSSILYEVAQPNFQPVIINYFTFIKTAHFYIPFSFQVDSLSALFLIIITGVGLLIHIYSVEYMHSETNPHFARYFSYLNLFVFFMLVLVLGANYMVLFIGWEGVGFCSYLLIGYWFAHKNNNYAARKAFVMNRIGDAAFLIGIFWVLSKTGSVSYTQVFNNLSQFSSLEITSISLLFFIGAMGKSAQIPLYTWLPDAMAGPTPVSALIHAATMVTAGIYMIVRSHVLYALSPFTSHCIAIVGLITLIVGASTALKQNDIKKVLAYSTVSQLGYMFLGLGVGAFQSSIFHVLTHAFFKALLFLGAGSVIHSIHNEQDLYKMGGLKKSMPVTHLTMLVGCLAIAGIPPLSGFFSKDAILASAFAFNPLYWFVALCGSAMTAFYMFRLYSLCFLGQHRNGDGSHLHESKPLMYLPLIILALLSALAGFLNIPSVLGNNGQHLTRFLAPLFLNEQSVLHENSHATEWILMGVSTLVALIFSLYALAKFSQSNPVTNAPKGIGLFLQKKWYVDELYDAIITKPILYFSNFLDQQIETKSIDKAVDGVGWYVLKSSRVIRLIQNGQVGSYLLLMVFSIVGMILLIFYGHNIANFYNQHAR